MMRESTAMYTKSINSQMPWVGLWSKTVAFPSHILSCFLIEVVNICWHPSNMPMLIENPGCENRLYRLSEAIPMRPFFRAKNGGHCRLHRTRGRNMRGKYIFCPFDLTD